MGGDVSREHWTVPVRSVTCAEIDGTVRPIARHDGTVILHLSCCESTNIVQLDVCNAVQLSTGIREAVLATMQTIGLRIQRIRYAQDKSLQVVAGLAGMSAPTLHRIEHGRREITLTEIAALATALRIEPEKLITPPTSRPG